jgi:hypothetical protein
MTSEKVSAADTKLMYEISKLTNTSKQIADDFIDTMVFTMFKDYLTSMADPVVFLEQFMEFWEKAMITQKQIELETLSNQEGSMLDMAAGAIIANSEDMDAFKEELSTMKELLTYALLGDGE